MFLKDVSYACQGCMFFFSSSFYFKITIFYDSCKMAKLNFQLSLLHSSEINLILWFGAQKKILLLSKLKTVVLLYIL